MEPIRSNDNPSVRQLGKLLSDGRARREASQAVAEGPHLLAEALRAGVVKELWATPEALEGAEAGNLLSAAGRLGLRPKLIAAELLKKLSDLPAPQGWLAVCETRTALWPAEPQLCLALDGVQDPGNVGTLLRSAWATNACVLLGPGCADPWSPKVLRAGVGAQFQVPFQSVPDLPAALQTLTKKGVRIFATLPKADLDLWETDLNRPCCLVLGTEGQGLSGPVLAACQASIKLAYPGKAESLNVGVAGALLLFEALRQQKPFRAR